VCIFFLPININFRVFFSTRICVQNKLAFKCRFSSANPRFGLPLSAIVSVSLSLSYRLSPSHLPTTSSLSAPPYLPLPSLSRARSFIFLSLVLSLYIYYALSHACAPEPTASLPYPSRRDMMRPLGDRILLAALSSWSFLPCWE
jgi:hypothetical protein